MDTARHSTALRPERDCAIDKCRRLGYEEDSESIAAAKRSMPLASARQRLMPTGIVTAGGQVNHPPVMLTVL